MPSPASAGGALISGMAERKDLPGRQLMWHDCPEGAWGAHGACGHAMSFSVEAGGLTGRQSGIQ